MAENTIYLKDDELKDEELDDIEDELFDDEFLDDEDWDEEFDDDDDFDEDDEEIEEEVERLLHWLKPKITKLIPHSIFLKNFLSNNAPIDICAQGRSRTGTGLLPRDFKSLASTNFATRATYVFKVGWGDARIRTGV